MHIVSIHPSIKKPGEIEVIINDNGENKTLTATVHVLHSSMRNEFLQNEKRKSENRILMDWQLHGDAANDFNDMQDNMLEEEMGW